MHPKSTTRHFAGTLVAVLVPARTAAEIAAAVKSPVQAIVRLSPSACRDCAGPGQVAECPLGVHRSIGRTEKFGPLTSSEELVDQHRVPVRIDERDGPGPLPAGSERRVKSRRRGSRISGKNDPLRSWGWSNGTDLACGTDWS